MHYIKLTTQQKNFHQRKSLKILRKITPILIFISILVGIGIIFAFLKTPASFDYSFKIPFVGYPFETSDDKVNVLLLGNAGSTYAGPYLTDTVIVASYNLKTQKAYFISLPRDLWLEKLKIKLNTVYAVGEAKGEGLKFSKSEVSGILGIPIHYAIRVDFKGFIKAIDTLEGIDVSVERSFDDFHYPLEGRENDLCGQKEEEREFEEEEAKKLNIEPGKRRVLITLDGKVATDSAEPDKGFEYFPCRFEHISFSSGLSHMDGETALKFVRSRMGTNNEGSDFARSKRQQKVIEATRKKALSFETLVKPKKLKLLLETFGKSFETDIPVSDMIQLYVIVKKLDSSTSFVLSNKGESALLLNPPPQDFGGAWVLLPRDGSFDSIREYVKKILEGGVKEDETTSSARTRN